MKHLKKQLSILILLLSISLLTSAQNYTSSFGISSGYVQDGIGVQAIYNYPLNNHEYLQGAAFLTFSKENYLDMSLNTNIYSLNVGYFNTVWRNMKRTINTSLGAGIIGGYENINNGTLELDNGALITSDSQFIYGVFIASENDIFLNDKSSLILKLQQYYHINSDAGNLIPFISIGYRRYIF